MIPESDNGWQSQLNPGSFLPSIFFTSTVEKAKKGNKKFPDRYTGSGDIVFCVPNALANLVQAVKAIMN